MEFYKNGKLVTDLQDVNYLLDGFVWIHGYDGLYMINKEGVLISIKRKHSKPTMIKKPYLRLSSSKYKYRQTKYYIHTLSKDRKPVERGLHRLLAECFIPNPENKKQVNHIDGNTLNNRLSNLEWVTPSENISHAYRIGLHRVTKNNLISSSKNGRKRRSLSFDDALKIRELYNSGICMNDLADMYNKPYYTINRIIIGETYVKR